MHGLNIRMSATSHPSLQSFLGRFRQQPVIQKLSARFAFATVATVETGRDVNFQQTCIWALGVEGFANSNLEGRVRPHLIFPEGDYALWDFEFAADAMLFALRFGGISRGPINVDQWRRDRLSALQ